MTEERDLKARPLELILRGVSFFYRRRLDSDGGATPQVAGQQLEALVHTHPG